VREGVGGFLLEDWVAGSTPPCWMALGEWVPPGWAGYGGLDPLFFEQLFMNELVQSGCFFFVHPASLGCLLEQQD